MKSIVCFLLVLLAIVAIPGTSGSVGVIEWSRDYSLGLEQARIERKPVMIDFYTFWCYYCKVLDTRTYTDPTVISTSQSFVSIKINAERERELARGFRISAYPIIVFLSRDGTEIDRIYGYVTAPVLKGRLDKILADTGRLKILEEKYNRSRDAEAAYLYADELMAKGNFREAEKVLAKAGSASDAKRKADIALDLAVCRFRQTKYKAAANELSKFLSKFKDSERANEAELFYGLSLISSGQKDKGLSVLDGLQEKAPGKWVGQEGARQAVLVRGPAK